MKLSLILLWVTLFSCLQAAETPVGLGAAGSFSILAGSTVTNTGPSVINGDVGLSPGSAVTGFPPGSVSGGALHVTDSAAALAQGALTVAFIDARDRSTAPITVAGDLGGLTLTPGLYKSTSSLGITGILRLNGQGNANSVFIIQVASALTTASGSQVLLEGNAQASNIFWQVGSSATLGTTSVFRGTILAQESISLATGAGLIGRALARTGAVTLDTNTLVNPGPPVISTPSPLAVTCPLTVAQVGVPYSSLLAATGGTSPYTFSVTGLLPAGLNLNASTGTVTGTPTGAGASPFSANALDSASATATASCSITSSVLPPPPPTVPAPSSWLLVVIGLSCLAVYQYRERILRLIRRT